MIRLRVYGDPAPQGSKNVGRNGQLYEASKKVGPWRKAVAEAVKAHGPFDTFDGPVEVDVTFWLPRPKSVRRVLPTVPPDVDKLIRGLLDPLTTGKVYHDDSQVVRVYAVKFYADMEYPGADVVISEVEDLPLAIAT